MKADALMYGNIEDTREGEEKKEDFLLIHLFFQDEGSQNHGEKRCGCLDDGCQGTLHTGEAYNLEQEKKDGIENGERKKLQEILPGDFHGQHL